MGALPSVAGALSLWYASSVTTVTGDDSVNTGTGAAAILVCVPSTDAREDGQALPLRKRPRNSLEVMPWQLSVLPQAFLLS